MHFYFMRNKKKYLLTLNAEFVVKIKLDNYAISFIMVGKLWYDTIIHCQVTSNNVCYLLEYGNKSR